MERQLSDLARRTLDASISKADDGKLDITIIVPEPPSGIALTMGDAVHNLRTALDHMTWEMVGRDRGTQDRYLMFPTGDSRLNFESRFNGMKTPSQSVRDNFKALEAFPGGKGEPLYALCHLDNSDKHKILTPVVNAPTCSDLVLVMEDKRCNLADLYGGNATLGHGETLTIDAAPPGSGLEFRDDAQFGSLVLFGDVELFKRQPVLPTVTRLRHAVTNAIDMTAKATVP